MRVLAAAEERDEGMRVGIYDEVSRKSSSVPDARTRVRMGLMGCSGFSFGARGVVIELDWVRFEERERDCQGRRVVAGATALGGGDVTGEPRYASSVVQYTSSGGGDDEKLVHVQVGLSSRPADGQHDVLR